MKRILLLFITLIAITGVASADIQSYNSYNVLLMHMNQSVDHPTFFNDTPLGTTTPKIFTAVGTETTNTTTKMFGNASAWFNGAGSYIKTPNSADFNFGSGDFTIMFWVYPTTTDRKGIAGTITSTGKSGWDIEQSAATTGQISLNDYNTAGIPSLFQTSGNAMVPNIWQQVVIQRAGTSLKIYSNSTQMASFTIPSGYTFNASTTTMSIAGQGEYVGRTLNGNIDEFGIWKGVAIPIADLYPQTQEILPIYNPVDPGGNKGLVINSSQIYNGTLTNWEGGGIQLLNGSYMSVWNHGPVSELDNSYVAYASISGDYGATWSPSYTIKSNASYATILPELLVVNRTTYLFYDVINAPSNPNEVSDIYVETSVDNGTTWGNKVQITHKTTDTRITRPILLSSGRIIVPGEMYNSTVSRYEPLLFYSDDKGATWFEPAHTVSAYGYSENFITQMKNGTLVRTIRDETYGQHVWISYSGNEGITWTTPVYYSEFTPISMIGAISDQFGDQFLIWNNVSSSTVSPRYPLTAGLSITNLTSIFSWSNINATPLAYSNFGLFMNKSGDIAIVYSDEINQNMYFASIHPQSFMNYSIPAADFTSNVTSGVFPFDVQFTDTSLNRPNQWNWSFGDGTHSIMQNPVKSYSASGMYNVSLTASNTTGNTTITRSEWVASYAPTPILISNFTATPLLSSIYSMPVQFTDSSTGIPTTWNWTFGDGYVGTAQNPLHTYMVAGYYDIGLNVTNASGGYNLLTKTQYIGLLSDSDTYLRSWNDFNSTISNDHQGVAWSTFGTPSISTAEKKFGAGSLYIPSSNSYIYSPSSSIWDRSTIAGEVEYWINITTLGDAGKPLVKRSTGATGTADGWGMLNINGTQNGYAFWYGNSATNYTRPFTLTSNVWHHVLLSRNTSAYWNVYVDGNFWSATYLDALQVDTANQFQIGASGAGNEFGFYLDEFRYSQGVDRVDRSYSVPLTAYVGSLQASIDTSPNSTLRYKTNPDHLAVIYNQTNGGIRNRTVQIQNITEATYIAGGLFFDPTTEKVKGIFVNSTDYPDIILVSSSVNYANGEVSFNVSRGGTSKFVSLFDNRTNLLDVEFLYYNYTIQRNGSQFFDYGYLINGTSSYPIHNFIATNITYGDWAIFTNFTSDKTTTNVGTPIQFTDLSTGEPLGYTAWLWNFGDGSTSTQQNPSYSYSANGNYSVALKSSLVANTSVTNTTIKTGYINITSVVSAAPVAAFSASPLVVAVGSPVSFTDASTNTPTSWSWDFGDISGSTLQNPTHSYSNVGNYTVILSATNAYGTGTLTKTNYIWVKASVSGYAQQDIIMDNYYTLTIYIKDASTGLAIPSASITDNLGNNQTTNDLGYAVFNEPYSIVTGAIYASGYNARSYSIAVDNDTTVSYSLTVASAASQQNTWWSPHLVQITVLSDTYGTRLPRVNISAYYNESAMPSAWVNELFGIRLSTSGEMVNASLRLGGTTGSDGTLTSTMLGSLKYDIYLTSTEYGLNNYHVSAYPSDSMLNIYVPVSGQKLPTSGNSTYTYLNNTRLYITQPNISYVSMCIDYQDLSGTTTSVIEKWWFGENDSVFGTETIANPGVTLVTKCKTLDNVRGTRIYWNYSAVTSI
jgi:PKD repeat protein